jgi:hypothetical protein
MIFKYFSLFPRILSYITIVQLSNQEVNIDTVLLSHLQTTFKCCQLIHSFFLILRKICNGSFLLDCSLCRCEDPTMSHFLQSLQKLPLRAFNTGKEQWKVVLALSVCLLNS